VLEPLVKFGERKGEAFDVGQIEGCAKMKSRDELLKGFKMTL
jgi:hypothetical protein